MKVKIPEKDVEFKLTVNNGTRCAAIHIPTGITAVYKTPDTLPYLEASNRARRVLSDKLQRFISSGCGYEYK